MKRLLITIYLLTGLMVAALAQTNRYGMPLITNYPPKDTRGSEQNWTIVQDNRGVLYIGNDFKGILEYDGNEWRTIQVANNSTIRSLATDDDGTVFVGAVAEFGYLAPDLKGTLSYRSLIPRTDTAYHMFYDVWKTYFHNGSVYFCTTKYILRYDISQDTVIVNQVPDNTLFSYIINNHFYLTTFTDGIIEMQADTFAIVKGSDCYSKQNIFAIEQHDDEQLIVGSSTTGLSLFNTVSGKVDYTFTSKFVNDYIIENGISHILKPSPDHYLVSTLTGGMLYLTHEGTLLEILTKENGLQDNTIYYSYIGEQSSYSSPLFSALSIGIAKTELNLPLRVFTEENSGLQGLIHAISRFGDRLYVGTKIGLFCSYNTPFGLKFKQIGDLNEVWDLESFKLDDKEVLLAASDDGLFQVDRQNNVTQLDFTIRDKADLQDSKYRVFCIYKDPVNSNRLYLGERTNLIYLSYRNGAFYEEKKLTKLPSEARFLGIDGQRNLFFCTSIGGIGMIPADDTTATFTMLNAEKGLPSLDGNNVNSIGGKMYIGTIDGIYNFDYTTGAFRKDSVMSSYLLEGKNTIQSIYQDYDGDFWISAENSLNNNCLVMLSPGDSGSYNIVSKPFFRLPDFSTDVIYSSKDDGVWFSNSNMLFHFDKEMPLFSGKIPRPLIRRVIIGNDSLLFNGSFLSKNGNGRSVISAFQSKENIPEIRYRFNAISFNWSLPYFESEEQTLFSYKLEGFMKDWSSWDHQTYSYFSFLPNGSYTFRVKAKTVFGEESEEGSYSFVILRPWYATYLAFLLYFISAVLIILYIIKLYTRRLKLENIRLEGIIQDRTAEIRKQKEELTDSIEYASRIQRALLPTEKVLEEANLEHFILFRPRDIVSGDFYWMGQKKNKVFFVAADCTGHGVPGAFMSMLGISFLDEIVIKSGVYETNEILDSLKEHVITSLKQSGKSIGESTKDGMDLSMVRIDLNTRSIQYSGAYNPMYYVRELSDDEKERIKAGEELDIEKGDIYNETHLLIQQRADQMPIGISEKELQFSAVELENKGYSIYLFSDGYLDQFGGPDGKKFMSKNFKKLLLDIQKYPIAEQRKVMEKTLLDWMGNEPQIDDILVVGIRL